MLSAPLQYSRTLQHAAKLYIMASETAYSEAWYVQNYIIMEHTQPQLKAWRQSLLVGPQRTSLNRQVQQALHSSDTTPETGERPDHRL